MLDTNTINFAMNKLAASFSKILPTISNTTQEYIQFKINQNCVVDIFVISFFVISLITFLSTYKLSKKLGWAEPTNINVICIIVGTVTVIMGIGAICCIYELIMLHYYPTMYIIDSMITK